MGGLNLVDTFQKLENLFLLAMTSSLVFGAASPISIIWEIFSSWFACHKPISIASLPLKILKRLKFLNSIYKAENLKENFYHPPCAVTFFKNLTKLSALLSQAEVFL